MPPGPPSSPSLPAGPPSSPRPPGSPSLTNNNYSKLIFFN